MKLGLILAFALAVAACGAAEQRSPTAPPPPSISTPASSPNVAPTAAPVVASTAPESPPAPPALASHLVEQLKGWDPSLGDELARLSLTPTSSADPERSRLYLEHRLRQELTVPALRRSSDPVLLKLSSELERISSFQEDRIAHLNLKMGPLEPQACLGCETEEPRCNRRRCERELGFLAPAVISAAGLDDDGTFEGHPIATNEGVTTTPSSGFAEYLEALEAAGVARDKIRSSLSAIAADLLRRSAILEGARPVAKEPGEPMARAVLRAGFERWRATYAENLAAPTLPELRGDSLDLALHDAYLSSEAWLYQPFRWSKIARLQSARIRFQRKLLAFTRAERAGKEPNFDSGSPPLDEEACLAGPPLPSRLCAETEAASALFLAFLDAVPGLEEKPQSAEKAAAELGLAFERLTLSGLAPARVIEFYRQWTNRAATR